MLIFPQTDRFQQHLVATLKANSTIAALFSNGSEIREHGWGGTGFVYPNLRVAAADEVTPQGNPDCDEYQITFRTIIFSEKESSAECQQLTTAVGEFVLNMALISSNYFSGKTRVRLVSSRPAIPFEREGKREWGSETVWQVTLRAKKP